jgi:DNA polymerase-3 subunit alpha
VDFLSRVDLRKVNKRTVESLIKAGAFDMIEKSRGDALNVLPDALDAIQKMKKRNSGPQMGLFGGGKKDDGIRIPLSEEGMRLSEKEKMKYEKEALGFYITGHPLDQISDLINTYGNVTTSSLVHRKNGTVVQIGGVTSSIQEKRTRKDERMGFLTFEDKEGLVDVVLFPDLYLEAEPLLSSSEPYFIVGRLEKDDRGAKIIAQQVIHHEDAMEKLSRNISIVLQGENVTRDNIQEIRKLFERFRGGKRSKIKLINKEGFEVVIELSDSYLINPSMKFAAELKEKLGYDAFDLR